MLSLYLDLPLNIKFDPLDSLIIISSDSVAVSWILGGDPVCELSEGDLAIRIQIHSPDDRRDVALLNVFLEFGKETS